MTAQQHRFMPHPNPIFDEILRLSDAKYSNKTSLEFRLQKWIHDSNTTISPAAGFEPAVDMSDLRLRCEDATDEICIENGAVRWNLSLLPPPAAADRRLSCCVAQIVVATVGEDDESSHEGLTGRIDHFQRITIAGDYIICREKLRRIHWSESKYFTRSLTTVMLYGFSSLSK
jgi:hypothetical protein